MEPEGFLAVPGRLTGGAEEAVDLCVWLADTPALQQRGLMNVTDLGDADGMLFVFAAPTEAAFYMWQTPLPLTVSFFDEFGRFVDETDMTPCLDGPAADCERYRSPSPYLFALEVPQGIYSNLLVRGAVLTVDLSSTCEPDTPVEHEERGGRCEGVVVGAPPASTPASTLE